MSRVSEIPTSCPANKNCRANIKDINNNLKDIRRVGHQERLRC